MGVINEFMAGLSIYIAILIVFDLVLIALRILKAPKSVMEVADYLYYVADKPFQFFQDCVKRVFVHTVIFLLFITDQILGN